jgi:hypothetical protein
MDVWETVTSKSSLTPASSYDFWEHLNAQGSISIIACDYEFILEDGRLELELDDTGFEMSVDDTDYYIEVCNE